MPSIVSSHATDEGRLARVIADLFNIDQDQSPLDIIATAEVKNWIKHLLLTRHAWVA